MNVLSVSLPEVLAASSVRAASLVPETSGYLALAVADASARLPFRLDDAMVSLTTEGTVKVARGTAIVAPEESAKRVRNVLARLLEHSIGSAPALANAARAKRESGDGVDGFIRELETALVPVNRAAARRALARLARETVRARDTGKLRRRKVRRFEEQAEAFDEPPQHEPIEEPKPAPRPKATREDEVRAKPARPAAPRAPARGAQEPQATSTAAQRGCAVEGRADDLAIDVEFSANPAPAQPAEDLSTTPFDPHAAEEAALAYEVPTTIDAPVDDPMADPALKDEIIGHEAATEPAPKKRDPLARAFGGSAKRSNVDDLLASFSVSDLTTGHSPREVRASLKKLAGLDPTPPPPTAEELRRFTAKPPSVEARDRMEARQSPARARSLGRATSDRAPTPTWAAVVLVTLGLVLAALLGHYLPSWIKADASNAHAAP